MSILNNMTGNTVMAFLSFIGAFLFIYVTYAFVLATIASITDTLVKMIASAAYIVFVLGILALGPLVSILSKTSEAE